MNREDELLTVREAAALAKVGEKTVEGWCRSGKLKAQKFGRDWRIRLSVLMAFDSRGELLSNGEVLLPRAAEILRRAGALN
jgi:excisionase family DNA binding protein